MPSEDTWTAVTGLKLTNYSKKRVRSWINTPNFGALPKDQKPVNRYDDLIRNYSQSNYAAYDIRLSDGLKTYQVPEGPYFTGYGLDTVEGQFLTNSGLPLNIDVANNENASMLKALGKVADAKVNVAVAYAEASKTSDLILGTARRIDRAYRAFRKGNLRQVARLLDLTPKTVHKTWLEYKYGWTPLLMDVKGAAEFFAQQHVGRPARFIVQARESRERRTSWTTYFSPNGGGALAPMYHTYGYECSARTKLWCEITNPHYSQLQQIGLTNPALIAWELVPFSFVFDWFISVGDWLTGLTALNGVTVRRVMQDSWFDRYYFRSTPATVRSDANYVHYETSLDLSLRKRQYGRGAPTVNPLSLYPPKTNSFSFQKMITSLALIRGQYRGSGSSRI